MANACLYRAPSVDGDGMMLSCTSPWIVPMKFRHAFSRLHPTALGLALAQGGTLPPPSYS